MQSIFLISLAQIMNKEDAGLLDQVYTKSYTNSIIYTYVCTDYIYIYDDCLYILPIFILYCIQSTST